MEKFIKNIKRNGIFVFIGFAVIGVLLIIFPAIVAKTASYIIGAVAVGFGVTKIVGYFSKTEGARVSVFGLAIGIISAIAGIYFIANPHVISGFIVSLFGVIVLVNGITKFRNAMRLKNQGINKWWSVLLTSVISSLIGIVFITNPGLSFDLMMRIIGGVLIFIAVSELWTIFCISKEYKSESVNTTVINHNGEIEGEGREIKSEDVDE
ncbi:MAG: DUF308 domain-containing protein [Clostridia bacterium]|nr:DUF308 domain-containing protein [Clostridia bacterium]